MMNERGRSDRSVVPGKPPNKAEGPAAEVVEGRERAEGNSGESDALRTPGQAGALSAFDRVRQAAKKDRKQRFTALLHHVYGVEHLRTAYHALKRDAAAGVDGETWQHYGEALESNLQDLSGRLARGRTGRSRSGGRTSRRRTGGCGRSAFLRWKTSWSSAPSSRS